MPPDHLEEGPGRKPERLPACRTDKCRHKLPACVLDGEIVVLDSDGRSLFYELMHSRAVPIFAAFDLLWLNGKDLRDEPLLERKRRLRTYDYRQPLRDAAVH